MDFFEDETYVRLRSVTLGRYVQADDDGIGVSMSPGATLSLRTTWAVRRVDHGGVSDLLLQSSALGLYLGFSCSSLPEEQRAVLLRYNLVHQRDVHWRPFRAVPGAQEVFLSLSYGPFSDWALAAPSYGDHDRHRRHLWIVEVIPVRDGPPLLLPSPPEQVQPGVLRSVRVVLMDAEGVVQADLHSVVLKFEGRSIVELRDAVAAVLGVISQDIVMCVRGGLLGHLIPLTVTLLPTLLAPMHLFILQTGTPAALALRYPDVGAE